MLRLSRSSNPPDETSSKNLFLVCIIRFVQSYSSESGGIGRRTRLRIWRVKPWGFESPLSHQFINHYNRCASQSVTAYRVRFSAPLVSERHLNNAIVCCTIG
jgi:hypothetical protein